MNAFFFLLMLGFAAFAVLFGWLAFVAIGFFMSRRESAIASFALMLGFLLHSEELLVLTDITDRLILILQLIGSVVGMTILWWLLFKRRLIDG